MNEPQPGSLSSLPVENLYTATAQDLFPFYRRVIEALTGVRDGLPTCPATEPTSLTNACAYPQLAKVNRQQIFVEPIGLPKPGRLLPAGEQADHPYPNLVWAPHIYTHAFTLDQFIGYPVDRQSVPAQLYLRLPNSRSRGPGHARRRVHNRIRRLVQHRQHGAGRRDGGSGGDSHRRHHLGLEGVVVDHGHLLVRPLAAQHLPDHSQRPTRQGRSQCPSVTQGCRDPVPEQYLSRVWPRRRPGHCSPICTTPYPVPSTWWPPAGDVHRGDRGAETLVYIPATVHGAVTITGGAVLDTVTSNPDGSRYAYVAPTGDSRYEIKVGRPRLDCRRSQLRGDEPAAADQ